MPELPEVETVKIGLQKLIVSKVISSISTDWQKSFPNDTRVVNKFILNHKIKNVRRRGKVLIIDLDSGYSIMTHLKMTGQLVYVGSARFGAGHPTDSLVGGLPDKSTRVIIQFSDKTHLYFNDQRKFGWMKVLMTQDIQFDKFITKLGPEPLEKSTTSKDFINRITGRSTTIKAALLDQSTVAGIGNIYADESLFASKIHPAEKVHNLNDLQLMELWKQIKYVLNLSIAKGGSTDRNYVNAEGKKGSYIEFAKVFRREGRPCYVCGSIIIKTRVASRGTHLCPNCQILKEKI